ncbi:MAG: heat-inducible transcriptional repressor HrcA [Eubacteriales bacterium]|nr:heat-inducible transcriptional repressor HrcA [Eubacteriales bacterium]
MDLTERKLKILQAIIRDFVSTAEPVGSRTLSRNHDLGVSAATIRNEMSDLEEMGYLTHPHTSAGRMPSEKAYRLYVDNIMQQSELSQQQKEMISTKLDANIHELSRTLEHAANLLSDITSLTSFAMMPDKEQERLKYIKIIKIDPKAVLLMIVSESGSVTNQVLRLRGEPDEDSLRLLSKTMTYSYQGKTINEALTADIRNDVLHDAGLLQKYAEDIRPRFFQTLEDMLNVNMYMEGLSNIFSLPEYSDVGKARNFMELLEKKDDFARKIIDRDDGLMITIGNENNDENMNDCSVITATYHINGKLVGKLGVIGPTRMRYSHITSVIEYLTENISDAFKITGGNDEDDDA